MTREEIKKAAEVMSAFADGVKIQCSRKEQDIWIDVVNISQPSFDWHTFDYRIKPEPKYRPFKTREECWNEISRHSFPQFLLRKEDKLIMTIGYIGTTGVTLNKINNGYLFQEMFNGFTFIDGEPFGIKENN